MVVMTVIGTRPQFIKCALLSKELRARGITEILVNTGQHYDENMSDIFIDELEIPHINYNLCAKNTSPIKQTAEMMTGVEEIIEIEKPTVGICYGDTNSTLSAALAFAKMQVPFAHIEAGLRSGDMEMVEEQNRVIADNLASVLFAPTKQAIKNLNNEGIKKNVFIVGDIMYDNIVRMKFNKYKSNPYVLATIHRAENVDDINKLREIMQGFSMSRKRIIFPTHPRTRKALDKYGIIMPYNVDAIPPMSYQKMLDLEVNAERIVTDSGGVQKEAYMFGVPCVTIRQSTEWTETIKDGMNKLIAANRNDISDAIIEKRKIKYPKKFYGKGDAYMKIADILGIKYGL